MTILGGAVRWIAGRLALAVFLVMLTLNVLTATLAGAAGLVTAGLAWVGVESVLASVQAELVETRRTLKNTKTDLDTAKKRTVQLEDDLRRTRADLDKTRGQVQKAQADLDHTRGQLEATRADLDSANSHVAVRDAELKKQRRTVRRLTSKIAKRTEVGAVRNVGSMFGESVPVYGIAVIVGVTGWEITDACLTMRDMEELNSAFGISDADVDRRRVCGLQVPTVDEVKTTIISGPGEVWAAVKENTPNLDLPDWAREISLRPIWGFITSMWPWGGEPA